jgi:hypothetical protein
MTNAPSVALFEGAAFREAGQTIVSNAPSGGGTAAVALKAMLKDTKNNDDRFIARLRLTADASDLSDRF